MMLAMMLFLPANVSLKEWMTFLVLCLRASGQ